MTRSAFTILEAESIGRDNDTAVQDHRLHVTVVKLCKMFDAVGAALSVIALMSDRLPARLCFAFYYRQSDIRSEYCNDLERRFR